MSHLFRTPLLRKKSLEILPKLIYNMKTGFELLEAQINNFDRIVSQLELTYNIPLPPLYRLFATLFKLGKFKYEMYMDLTNNLNYCTGIYYKPKGLGSD